MKRFLTLMVVMTMIFGVFTECFSEEEVSLTDPDIILVDCDKRAIKVEERTVDLVQNEEDEDSGDVYIQWGEDVTCTYGYGVARMGYKNPGESNMGVKIELIIFDNVLYEYFGTTFKPDDVLDLLALEGFRAMSDGIANIDERDMLFVKGITRDYNFATQLDFEGLVDILVQNEFLGYSIEDWYSLNEENIHNLSEYEKLMIAQFGNYTFNMGNFLVVGETGVIYPGYKLSLIDLHEIGNGYILPEGNYPAQFHITGYDLSRGVYSDMSVNMPVRIHILKTISKKRADQLGFAVAKRIK